MDDTKQLIDMSYKQRNALGACEHAFCSSCDTCDDDTCDVSCNAYALYAMRVHDNVEHACDNANAHNDDCTFTINVCASCIVHEIDRHTTRDSYEEVHGPCDTIVRIEQFDRPL